MSRINFSLPKEMCANLSTHPNPFCVPMCLFVSLHPCPGVVSSPSRGFHPVVKSPQPAPHIKLAALGFWNVQALMAEAAII
jgi:hypothetical protein